MPLLQCPACQSSFPPGASPTAAVECPICGNIFSLSNADRLTPLPREGDLPTAEQMLLTAQKAEDATRRLVRRAVYWLGAGAGLTGLLFVSLIVVAGITGLTTAGTLEGIGQAMLAIYVLGFFALPLLGMVGAMRAFQMGGDRGDASTGVACAFLLGSLLLPCFLGVLLPEPDLRKDPGEIVVIAFSLGGGMTGLVLIVAGTIANRTLREPEMKEWFDSTRPIPPFRDRP